MPEPRPAPPSWLLSPWVKWSWLLVVMVVVAQSLSFHWRVLPTTADGYWSRGRRDFLNEDFEAAIDNLSKSIARNPNNAEVFIYRGVCYAELEEFSKAIADVRTALKMRPDYARAHAAHADVLAAMWDSSGAFDEYTRALELDPGYMRCAAERGMLSYDRGRWRDAEADFRRRGRELVGTHQPIMPLFIWLARARAGDAAGASEELRGVLKAGKLHGDRFWAAAQFLTDQIAESTYLAALKDLDDDDLDYLKAEALLLAGSKRLVGGDRAGAVPLLREALASASSRWYPRDRARVELETMLLGLHPKRTDDEDAELEVVSVTPGGPAEAAGVRPGWVLESIDGVPADQDSFVELLAHGEQGSAVALQFRSADGAPSTISLTLTPGSSEPTR